MQPETRYAKSGDVHIAYQVVGDGSIDLVYVPGWVSHVELQWEDPSWARALTRLASFSRLIMFDKRGTGMSDRVPEAALPSLEQRMDDLRAVMGAAGSERAVLLGSSEGGPLSLLFACTYPERVAGLVLYGSYPTRKWAPDYPWGVTSEEQKEFAALVERNWVKGGDIGIRNPTLASDPRLAQLAATRLRMSASPGAALALLEMNFEIDVRPILPAIRVPTLIVHRVGDQRVSIGGARYMAERIVGAMFVELPGDDHDPWAGDSDRLVDEIEEFVTGERHAVETDRILATVLFTDIVGSTENLTAMGDRRWRDVLAEHYRLARRELGRFRGREVKTTGDGLLASFDGPARAVRCAVAIRDVVRPLGIEIRAGLHTGEVDVLEDDLGGIAVHVGARVMAEAGPGEVMASSTVKDLVAGSGLVFDDRGMHTLRGVRGEWRLFRVIP